MIYFTTFTPNIKEFAVRTSIRFPGASPEQALDWRINEISPVGA
jgi:hypothetical protein